MESPDFGEHKKSLNQDIKGDLNGVILEGTTVEKMKEDLIRRINMPLSSFNDSCHIPNEPSLDENVKFYSPFKTSNNSSGIKINYDSLSPPPKVHENKTR